MDIDTQRHGEDTGDPRTTQQYIPIAILAIGYPDEHPQPEPREKPLAEITFLDRYGNPLA